MRFCGCTRMTTFPSFCSYSDGKDNETAKGYHRKNETGKVDISALIVAPNDATGNTTSVDDIIVPQDDSWSVSKEESSRNEAVEDDWMDMKPGNVETMGSERSDLFTPMIEHASQHIGNDQLLFVPQVHIQQASESDTSSNVCPFAYNGGIRDWELRCDNNSAVPSDVSDESTGSEHMLIHHQPSVDNNDGSQQWYAPSSTGRTQVSKSEEWTRGSVSFPGDANLDMNGKGDKHSCECQLCRQCHQMRINTILYPCHDVCLCTTCAQHLKSTNQPCPQCYQLIISTGPANLA